MELQTLTGLRHAPVQPPPDGKGPAPSVVSLPVQLTPAPVTFAGHEASLPMAGLVAPSRKRKRDEGAHEDLGGGAGAPTSMLELAQHAGGEAALLASGQILQGLPPPAVPSFAGMRTQSALDIEAVQREFRARVGLYFAGTLEHKQRQASDLVEGVLARLTPAQAEIVGQRLGRELQEEMASTGRGELLFAIVRGYAHWFMAAPPAREAAGDAALAGLLRGLARSPSGQGPDPEVSLASEFLACSQCLRAPEGVDGKACPSSVAAAKRKAQERDKVFTIFGNEDLAKRLAAIACAMEGGPRIEERALVDIVREVLRVPDEPVHGDANDLRHALDARDIGDLLQAIIKAIDDGRGSLRKHLPGLVKGLLSLDRDGGLTPDEVGLAVGYVVDKCSRQIHDAQEALNLVIDTSGPGLRTRGAVALAVGAVYGLSEHLDRIAIQDDPADLTTMLQTGMDVSLQQVGVMAQGRPVTRKDVLIRSLLAYRQHAAPRLRKHAEADRRDADREGRVFDPESTALQRFDAGMADLLSRWLAQAGKATQWDWLVRHGRSVQYASQTAAQRFAIRERLLPPALRDVIPQPGESAARVAIRLQQREDMLDRIDRALALPGAPLAIVGEPGLDADAQMQLLELAGYFTTRTIDEVRAKVDEVLQCGASMEHQQWMLRQLEARTRVQGLKLVITTPQDPTAGGMELQAPSSSSFSSSFSSSSLPAVVSSQPAPSPLR